MNKIDILKRELAYYMRVYPKSKKIGEINVKIKLLTTSNKNV